MAAHVQMDNLQWPAWFWLEDFIAAYIWRQDWQIMSIQARTQYLLPLEFECW